MKEHKESFVLKKSKTEERKKKRSREKRDRERLRITMCFLKFLFHVCYYIIGVYIEMRKVGEDR